MNKLRESNSVQEEIMTVNVLMIFKESYETLILLNLRTRKSLIHDKLAASRTLSLLARPNLRYVSVSLGHQLRLKKCNFRSKSSYFPLRKSKRKWLIISCKCRSVCATKVQALPNGGKCQQIMITANLYGLTVKIHTRQDITKLIRLRAAPPFRRGP